MRRLTATLALLAGGAFASPLDADTANQTNATINPVPVTTQARDQAQTVNQTLTQTAGVSRAIDHYAQAPEVSGDRFRLYGAGHCPARREGVAIDLAARAGEAQPLLLGHRVLGQEAGLAPKPQLQLGPRVPEQRGEAAIGLDLAGLGRAAVGVEQDAPLYCV
ncbi:MAG: hypothetical protein AAFV96_09020, partial [Pseudomonadota bacterium]